MNNQDATTLLQDAGQLMGTITGVLIAFGVLWVIITAVRFATAKSDKRTEFRGQLITSLIALAVIFSIFGIIKILQNTVFGNGQLNNSASQQNLLPPTLGV